MIGVGNIYTVQGFIFRKDVSVLLLPFHCLVKALPIHLYKYMYSWKFTDFLIGLSAILRI